MARIKTPDTTPDEAAAQKRRADVARLYLQGRRQVDIASAVGVNQSTVSRDLDHLRREWQADAKRSIDQRAAEELARIDRIEATAWEAWERSCRDAEALHAETVRGRADKHGKPLPELQRTSKTVKGQAGDPRFLERVGWCVERRCKILGLDAPEKHEHTGSITLEQRRAGLLALAERLRERAGADRN